MNCKNCHTTLTAEAKFCPNCGAKVVQERMTLKKLLSDILEALGYDSKFFVTLRRLIFSPEKPLGEYLAGVRKRYMNPFTFFAIGAAVALLIFDQFDKEYIALTGQMGEAQAGVSGGSGADVPLKLSNEVIQKTILKYFNLFSFLLLPAYTWVAFIVFGKPYNYGEHLVINAYLQGFSLMLTALFFLVSIFTFSGLYGFSFLLTIIYYSYTYARLYQHNVWQALFRLLKFIGVLLLLAIALFLAGVVIGLLIRYFK